VIALLLCLAIQDVDKLVDQLSADDIHERDEARVALRKLPLEIKNARSAEDGDAVGVAADSSGLEIDLVGLWRDARKNGYRLEPPK